MSKTKKKKMAKPAMEQLVREFHKRTWDKDFAILASDKRRRAFAEEKGMTTRQFGDVLRTLGNARVRELDDEVYRELHPEPKVGPWPQRIGISVVLLTIVGVPAFIWAWGTAIAPVSSVEDIETVSDCMEYMEQSEQHSPATDLIYCNERYGD